MYCKTRENRLIQDGYVQRHFIVRRVGSIRLEDIKHREKKENVNSVMNYDIIDSDFTNDIAFRAQ